MQWYRGRNCNVQRELNQLRDQLPKSSSEPHSPSGEKANGFIDVLRSFQSPRCYKPTLILISLFFLMQSTGTFAVIFYAVNIFQDIGGASSDPYLAAIITGIIRLVGKLMKNTEQSQIWQMQNSLL